jgi:hypothetical protein
MLVMAEVAFWCAVALVAYAYAGYPCALLVLSRFRDRPVRRGMPRTVPRVSVIIAAHNEQAGIAAKIENTLAQDHSPHALEVIVASDCSTDATDAIVGRYAGRVRLVRSAERRGKEAAQALALRSASGEILVFTDVATRLAATGVSTMVANFSDPTVGCVSSIDRFVDGDGRVSGEGAYVRYEMALRSLESRVNGLVGLSGSFFAVRREVARHWAADCQSDFAALLTAVELGWRGVLDAHTAGYYRNIADDRRERERKTRTVVRGLFVLARHAHMLDPFRYGLFAWQLASHKLCRWLVPHAMIAALATNALLASRSTFYALTLALQAGFYLAALAGLVSRAPFLKIPSFLLSANFGVLLAWLRYARGDRIATWSPSQRLGAPRPAGTI